MASITALVRDKFSQIVFKELTVEVVRDVTPHFRRMRVAGDWVRAASCSAGDKLQIMIADAGMRTYTPFARNASAGTFELLAFVHGATPGANWIKRAAPGVSFRAFGPRGSLPLTTLPGPLVFVGDETSFAAAAALRDARGKSDALAFVFETSLLEESETALADLGIESSARSQVSLVPKQSDDAHLPALEAAVRQALTTLPKAQLVLTGHAQTIQTLRAGLKAHAPAYAGQKTKAYWADGKRGLD
ncbi:MAG: hypothetical protein RL701_2539 [Pseudomonadota bacterium]